MAKKRSVKPEETVHTMLKQPIETRRQVLQGAVHTVELLKRYQVVKNIRKEKLKALDEFKKEVRAIARLLREIRFTDLPLKHEELLKVRDSKNHLVYGEEKVVKKKVKKKSVKRFHKNPLDDDLDALRRKLASL